MAGWGSSPVSMETWLHASVTQSQAVRPGSARSPRCPGDGLRGLRFAARAAPWAAEGTGPRAADGPLSIGRPEGRRGGTHAAPTSPGPVASDPNVLPIRSARCCLVLRIADARGTGSVRFRPLASVTEVLLVAVFAAVCLSVPCCLHVFWTQRHSAAPGSAGLEPPPPRLGKSRRCGERHFVRHILGTPSPSQPCEAGGPV